MSARLNTFLQLPRTTTPGAADDAALYCIIDTVREPKALRQLYQHDGVTDIERLFHGTSLAELKSVSPIWVAIRPNSTLAAAAMRLCQRDRSGILISSSASPEDAFLHAQRLVQMKFEGHGNALARFYDPALWSALALTTSRQLLYGPWHSVHVPPAYLDDQQWRTWYRAEDISDAIVADAYPLHLATDTLEAADDIRWWYWLGARLGEKTRELGDEQLAVVIANLQLLGEHGIDDGQHLERLLPRLNSGYIRENPEILGVLGSALSAFEKVQQLEI